MSYRVHRLHVDLEKEDHALEKFLNELDGEVVSILPHVRRPTLAWIYGVQRSVNFVVIVEKVA